GAPPVPPASTESRTTVPVTCRAALCVVRPRGAREAVPGVPGAGRVAADGRGAGVLVVGLVATGVVDRSGAAIAAREGVVGAGRVTLRGRDAPHEEPGSAGRRRLAWTQCPRPPPRRRPIPARRPPPRTARRPRPRRSCPRSSSSRAPWRAPPRAPPRTPPRTR